MTREQRSRQSFIRELKASRGLTHREAQAAYRELKGRLERPPAKADIERHPRLTGNAIKAARGGPAPAAPRERGSSGSSGKSAADRRQAAERAAIAQKRSQAAQQGWETRRQAQQERERAERAEKRSQAARKGWETRREREALKIQNVQQWEALHLWEFDDAELEIYHQGGIVETRGKGH